MTFNRLLGFHVVRSTRPCVFIPACFLGQKAYRNPRDPAHIEKHPGYPDPQYFLNYTQKYFFRHASLRHLRVEQFNRYLTSGDSDNAKTSQTAEDTIEDVPEDAPPAETHHRHYANSWRAPLLVSTFRPQCNISQAARGESALASACLVSR